MLAVVVLNGHRYVLGPVRDWEGWLDQLARVLGDGLVLERVGAHHAEVQHRATRQVVYSLHREAWPQEAEPWSPTEQGAYS